MKQITELQFQIAFGAVKHFGRNLYTTNPPAIAELIANAWDAYATECKLQFKEKELLIIDNGIGMTDDEFQFRYATSGYEKDKEIRIPEGFNLRPYMGRKGIGKFSAFSLTDIFYLFTKSVNDKQWKRIKLDHDILDTKNPTVTVPIARIDNLDHLSKLFGIDMPIEHGTVLYFPKLKRRITSSTYDSLSLLLARRFSVTALINDDNFNLSIDEIPVNLKEHFYDQYLEYIHYIGVTKKIIKKRFPQIDDKNLIEIKSKYLEDNGVFGWIASVDKPKKLKTFDGTRLTGVSIYINGKIADENILKFSKHDRIVNSYIIGEFDTDYLQDLKQDPVLSGREGLNLELQEVVDLKKEVTIIRDSLIEKWNDMRAARDISKQDYLANILQKPEHKKVFDALLKEDQKKVKKYAQRLFDKPSELNEQIVDLYIPAIMTIVNDETLESISINNDIESAEIIKIFAKLFDISEINQALRMRSNVKNRISIIDELSKHISSGEVEKVFENHLAKNPWLIEPYWDAIHLRVSQQDKFSYLNIDNSESRFYTDIIVEVGEEIFPVIVEVKREKKTSYSTPDVSEIIKQVNNYRKAIIKEYGKKYPDSHHNIYSVKAYFISGTASREKLDQEDYQQLVQNKIEYRTYEQLLRMSRNIYIDSFEKI